MDSNLSQDIAQKEMPKSEIDGSNLTQAEVQKQILEFKSELAHWQQKYEKLYKSARKHKTLKNMHLKALISQQRARLDEQRNCRGCRKLDREISDIKEALSHIKQEADNLESSVREKETLTEKYEEKNRDLTHRNEVLESSIWYARRMPVTNPLGRRSAHFARLAEERKRIEEESEKHEETGKKLLDEKRKEEQEVEKLQGESKVVNEKKKAKKHRKRKIQKETEKDVKSEAEKKLMLSDKVPDTSE